MLNVDVHYGFLHINYHFFMNNETLFLTPVWNSLSPKHGCQRLDIADRNGKWINGSVESCIREYSFHEIITLTPIVSINDVLECFFIFFKYLNKLGLHYKYRNRSSNSPAYRMIHE